ncbi:MAG: hypothetical protein WAM14_03280 [Candidatus Nitrosopolaris sp.]
MNHKNTTTAIAAIVVAIALTSVGFTVPRHALAWGCCFPNNDIKVSQWINQINACTSSPQDNKQSSGDQNTYKQSSYDPNTKPASSGSHDNINQAVGASSTNSSEDSSDNKNPSSSYDNTNPSSSYDNTNPSSGDDNKKPSSSSTLCLNVGSNSADVNR